MSYSFKYAFGRRGRHARSVAGGARSYIEKMYRDLPSHPGTTWLWKQSFGIQSVLFGVLYSEEEHLCYGISRRYENELRRITEVEYRRACLAYASFFIVLMDLVYTDGLPAEDQRSTMLNTAWALYDDSEPSSDWAMLADFPDSTDTHRLLLLDLSRHFGIVPFDEEQFAADWLSLLPSMDSAVERFTAIDIS